MDPANTAVTPTPKFELAEFTEGFAKGFKFNIPVYDSLADFVQVFGEESILNLLKTQTAQRVRAKVKNGLPKDVKPQDVQAELAKLKTRYPDGVLFTESDAAAWRPDQERISINRLWKEVKAASDEGNVPLIQELMAKIAKYLGAEQAEAAETPEAP